MKHLILTSLNLSENEKAVLAAIEKQKMARDTAKIARSAGVPRTTAAYILKKFEKWKIVKTVSIKKRKRWMVNKLMQ